MGHVGPGGGNITEGRRGKGRGEATEGMSHVGPRGENMTDGCRGKARGTEECTALVAQLPETVPGRIQDFQDLKVSMNYVDSMMHTEDEPMLSQFDIFRISNNCCDQLHSLQRLILLGNNLTLEVHDMVR